MKLPIKKVYFDAILAGDKTLEYRADHLTLVCIETGEMLRADIEDVSMIDVDKIIHELKLNEEEAEEMFPGDKAVVFYFKDPRKYIEFPPRFASNKEFADYYLGHFPDHLIAKAPVADEGRSRSPSGSRSSGSDPPSAPGPFDPEAHVLHDPKLEPIDRIVGNPDVATGTIIDERGPPTPDEVIEVLEKEFPDPFPKDRIVKHERRRLKPGDVVELKRRMKVYARRTISQHNAISRNLHLGRTYRGEPNHSMTTESVVTQAEEGRYLIVRSVDEPPGTGHGDHDVYPGGNKVFAKRLKGDLSYDPLGREFSWYQDGCFTIVHEKMKVVDVLEPLWKNKKDLSREKAPELFPWEAPHAETCACPRCKEEKKKLHRVAHKDIDLRGLILHEEAPPASIECFNCRKQVLLVENQGERTVPNKCPHCGRCLGCD